MSEYERGRRDGLEQAAQHHRVYIENPDYPEKDNILQGWGQCICGEAKADGARPYSVIWAAHIRALAGTSGTPAPAAPATTPMPHLIINLAQAKALLELFDEQDTEITLDSSTGKLLAWFTEYPDEGSTELGAQAAAPITTPANAKPIWKNEEFQSRVNAAIDDTKEQAAAPGGKEPLSLYKACETIAEREIEKWDWHSEGARAAHNIWSEIRTLAASHPLQDKPPGESK